MTSCVLIVCNRDYAKYAAALCRQIKAVEPSPVDVLIASPDDIASDVAGAGAEVLPIDVGGYVDELPSSERLGGYCYWRFPAIEAAVNSYDRVLYLDTDIYCAAPGIGDLMSIDMGKRPVAAVRDVHVQYDPRRAVCEYRSVGLEHAGYFNSGVLLVDAENWRRADAGKRLEEVCARHPDALVRQDQSAMNLAFYRNWLEISPVWNWQFSKRNAYAALHAGPRLYHYSGENKLWTTSPDRVVRSHWLVYQSLISAPAEAPVKVDADMKPFLLASIWYRRALLRYLDSFAHDLDVIDHGPGPHG